MHPEEDIAIRVVALDSSGEVLSLYITESSVGDRNITFDDNGDGSRTLRWRVSYESSIHVQVGTSFAFEFVAVAASDPTVVAIPTLELLYVPGDDPFELPPDIHALVLPSSPVESVVLGDGVRLELRVAWGLRKKVL